MGKQISMSENIELGRGGFGILIIKISSNSIFKDGNSFRNLPLIKSEIG